MGREEFFQYREFAGQFRPVIIVSFTFGGETHEFPMLIDSGADSIVLPFELLDAWDLPRGACSVASGHLVYGVASGLVYPDALVSVPELSEAPTFAAPVVFLPHMDGRPYGLLGREPALDHSCWRFGHDRGFGYWLEATAN